MSNGYTADYRDSFELVNLKTEWEIATQQAAKTYGIIWHGMMDAEMSNDEIARLRQQHADECALVNAAAEQYYAASRGAMLASPTFAGAPASQEGK